MWRDEYVEFQSNAFTHLQIQTYVNKFANTSAYVHTYIHTDVYIEKYFHKSSRFIVTCELNTKTKQLFHQIVLDLFSFIHLQLVASTRAGIHTRTYVHIMRQSLINIIIWLIIDVGDADAIVIFDITYIHTYIYMFDYTYIHMYVHVYM